MEKIKGNLSGVDKTILYAFLGLTAVCIVVTFVYYAITMETGGALVLKEGADLDFNGRVESVYRDKKNHNAKTVVLRNGFVYEVYAEWEPLIEIGDSLSKVKGSLDVIVYKKNKSKIVLNYMKLAKSRGWEL